MARTVAPPAPAERMISARVRMIRMIRGVRSSFTLPLYFALSSTVHTVYIERNLVTDSLASNLVLNGIGPNLVPVGLAPNPLNMALWLSCLWTLSVVHEVWFGVLMVPSLVCGSLCSYRWLVRVLPGSIVVVAGSMVFCGSACGLLLLQPCLFFVLGYFGDVSALNRMVLRGSLCPCRWF